MGIERSVVEVTKPTNIPPDVRVMTEVFATMAAQDLLGNRTENPLLLDSGDYKPDVEFRNNVLLGERYTRTEVVKIGGLKILGGGKTKRKEVTSSLSIVQRADKIYEILPELDTTSETEDAAFAYYLDRLLNELEISDKELFSKEGNLSADGQLIVFETIQRYLGESIDVLGENYGASLASLNDVLSKYVNLTTDGKLNKVLPRELVALLHESELASKLITTEHVLNPNTSIDEITTIALKKREDITDITAPSITSIETVAKGYKNLQSKTYLPTHSAESTVIWTNDQGVNMSVEMAYRFANMGFDSGTKKIAKAALDQINADNGTNLTLTELEFLARRLLQNKYQQEQELISQGKLNPEQASILEVRGFEDEGIAEILLSNKEPDAGLLDRLTPKQRKVIQLSLNTLRLTGVVASIFMPAGAVVSGELYDLRDNDSDDFFDEYLAATSGYGMDSNETNDVVDQADHLQTPPSQVREDALESLARIAQDKVDSHNDYERYQAMADAVEKGEFHRADNGGVEQMVYREDSKQTDEAVLTETSLENNIDNQTPETTGSRVIEEAPPAEHVDSSVEHWQKPISELEQVELSNKIDDIQKALHNIQGADSEERTELHERQIVNVDTIRTLTDDQINLLDGITPEMIDKHEGNIQKLLHEEFGIDASIAVQMAAVFEQPTSAILDQVLYEPAGSDSQSVGIGEVTPGNGIGEAVAEVVREGHEIWGEDGVVAELNEPLNGGVAVVENPDGSETYYGALHFDPATGTYKLESPESATTHAGSLAFGFDVDHDVEPEIVYKQVEQIVGDINVLDTENPEEELEHRLSEVSKYAGWTYGDVKDWLNNHPEEESITIAARSYSLTDTGELNVRTNYIPSDVNHSQYQENDLLLVGGKIDDTPIAGANLEKDILFYQVVDNIFAPVPDELNNHVDHSPVILGTSEHAKVIDLFVSDIDLERLPSDDDLFIRTMRTSQDEFVVQVVYAVVPDVDGENAIYDGDLRNAPDNIIYASQFLEGDEWIGRPVDELKTELHNIVNSDNFKTQIENVDEIGTSVVLSNGETAFPFDNLPETGRVITGEIPSEGYFNETDGLPYGTLSLKVDIDGDNTTAEGSIVYGLVVLENNQWRLINESDITEENGQKVVQDGLLTQEIELSRFPSNTPVTLDVDEILNQMPSPEGIEQLQEIGLTNEQINAVADATDNILSSNNSITFSTWNDVLNHYQSALTGDQLKELINDGLLTLPSSTGQSVQLIIGEPQTFTTMLGNIVYTHNSPNEDFDVASISRDETQVERFYNNSGYPNPQDVLVLKPHSMLSELVISESNIKDLTPYIINEGGNLVEDSIPGVLNSGYSISLNGVVDGEILNDSGAGSGIRILNVVEQEGENATFVENKFVLVTIPGDSNLGTHNRIFLVELSAEQTEDLSDGKMTQEHIDEIYKDAQASVDITLGRTIDADTVPELEPISGTNISPVSMSTVVDNSTTLGTSGTQTTAPTSLSDLPQTLQSEIQTYLNELDEGELPIITLQVDGEEREFVIVTTSSNQTRSVIGEQTEFTVMAGPQSIVSELSLVELTEDIGIDMRLRAVGPIAQDESTGEGVTTEETVDEQVEDGVEDESDSAEDIVSPTVEIPDTEFTVGSDVVTTNIPIFGGSENSTSEEVAQSNKLAEESLIEHGVALRSQTFNEINNEGVEEQRTYYTLEINADSSGRITGSLHGGPHFYGIDAGDIPEDIEGLKALADKLIEEGKIDLDEFLTSNDKYVTLNEIGDDVATQIKNQGVALIDVEGQLFISTAVNSDYEIISGDNIPPDTRILEFRINEEERPGSVGDMVELANQKIAEYLPDSLQVTGDNAETVTNPTPEPTGDTTNSTEPTPTSPPPSTTPTATSEPAVEEGTITATPETGDEGPTPVPEGTIEAQEAEINFVDEEEYRKNILDNFEGGDSLGNGSDQKGQWMMKEVSGKGDNGIYVYLNTDNDIDPEYRLTVRPSEGSEAYVVIEKYENNSYQRVDDKNFESLTREEFITAFPDVPEGDYIELIKGIFDRVAEATRNVSTPEPVEEEPTLAPTVDASATPTEAQKLMEEFPPEPKEFQRLDKENPIEINLTINGQQTKFNVSYDLVEQIASKMGYSIHLNGNQDFVPNNINFSIGDEYREIIEQRSSVATTPPNYTEDGFKFHTISIFQNFNEDVNDGQTIAGEGMDIIREEISQLLVNGLILSAIERFPEGDYKFEHLYEALKELGIEDRYDSDIPEQFRTGRLAPFSELTQHALLDVIERENGGRWDGLEDSGYLIRVLNFEGTVVETDDPAVALMTLHSTIQSLLGERILYTTDEGDENPITSTSVQSYEEVVAIYTNPRMLNRLQEILNEKNINIFNLLGIKDTDENPKLDIQVDQATINTFNNLSDSDVQGTPPVTSTPEPTATSTAEPEATPISTAEPTLTQTATATISAPTATAAFDFESLEDPRISDQYGSVIYKEGDDFVVTEESFIIVNRDNSPSPEVVVKLMKPDGSNYGDEVVVYSVAGTSNGNQISKGTYSVLDLPQSVKDFIKDNVEGQNQLPRSESRVEVTTASVTPSATAQTTATNTTQAPTAEAKQSQEELTATTVTTPEETASVTATSIPTEQSPTAETTFTATPEPTEEVKETATSEIEPFVTPEPTTAPLEPVPGEGVDTDAMLEDAGIPEDMKKPLIIGSVATLGILTAAFGGFALYRRRQEKIRDEEFREGLGINEDQHNEIKNAIINSDLFERVSWALGSPLILSDERIYLETPQYVHIFYPSEQVVLSNKDNSSLDLNRGQIRTLFSRNLLGSGESSYDRNIRYSISFDTQDISQNEVVDREDILRRIENDVKNTNEIPEILGRLLSPELPQGIIETLKLKKGINKITDLNELRRIVGQTIIEEIDRVGDYYTFTTREIPGLEGLGIYEYVLVENFSSTPEEEPLLDLTDVVLGDSTFIVSDKFREYKEKDDIRSQLELALNQPIIGENSKVAYYYSQYSGYDAWILNGDIRIRDKDISKIISLEPEQEALLASRSYIYSNAIDGNPTFDNRDEYVNSLLAGYKNLFSDELNENDVQGLLQTVINNDVLSSDIPESVISDLSERNPDSNPDDFREKFVEVLVRKIINNEVTLQTRTIPEMPDGISAWEFVVVDAEVDQSDRNDLVAEPLISEAAVDVESEGAEYTILDITPGATVYDTYIEIRGKYNDPDMGLTSNEFSRRLPSNVLYTLRNIEKDTRGSDNITRIVLNEINRRTALWLSDDASESGNIDYENLPEAEVLELLEYAGLIIKDADTSTEDVMQIKGKLKVDREKVAGKERLTEKFNELLVIPVEQAETIMKEEPFTETESTSESGDSVELSFQNAEATKRALLHYNMRRLGELVELVGGQLDENAKDEIVSGRREVRFSPVTDERSEEKWLVEKTDLLEIIKNKREEINAVVGSEISDEEIVLDLIRGRLVYTVDETDDSKFVFKSNKIERIDDTGDLANRMPDLVKMGYVTLTNEVVDDFIDVSEDGDTTRKIADRINEGVAEGKYQLRVEEENLGGIEGWVVKVSLVEENRTDAEKRLIELASSPQDKELVGREAEDVEDLPVDNPILPIMGTETVIDTDSNTENLRAYLTTNEITLPNEEILDLVRNVIKNELQTDRTGLKRELDLIINEIMNNQDPNADTVRKNTITAISNAAKIITAQLTNNEYQQLLNKITIKLRSRLGKLDLPKQITETTAQYYILEIMYASIK